MSHIDFGLNANLWNGSECEEIELIIESLMCWENKKILLIYL